MDIDLLSKMVKELIMNSEEVTLPGVGTFVTEIVPSTFSDKGYTINPPYRRLYFRQRQNPEDDSLVELYASSNKIDIGNARRILVDFLEELKGVLKDKKTIVFPGLGRLRATRENNFFFVADEDLDIYPAGFGLEPISLKTHEETPEEVGSAVKNLKDILDEAVPAKAVASESVAVPVQPVVPEPVAVPAQAVAGERKAVYSEPSVEIQHQPKPERPAAQDENDAPVLDEPAPVPVVEEKPVPATEEKVEPVVEEKPAPVAEEKAEPVVEEKLAPVVEEKAEPIVEEKSVPVAEEEAVPEDHGTGVAEPRPKRWPKILMWIVIGLAALLLLYIVIGRLAPDFIDRFLYSEEDLEFLRRQNL